MASTTVQSTTATEREAIRDTASVYQPDFLPTELSAAVLAFVSGLQYHNPYPYILGGLTNVERLSPRKTAPKREFAIRNTDGSMPGPYVWGQFQEGYNWVEDAPPVLRDVATAVAATFGERVNHFIIIEYSDPKITKANPHHDKDDQWADGASFFNLSFVEGEAAGTPRLFQISQGKQVVWEKRLAHNSCLKVDGTTNRAFKHAVPPRAKGEAHCKRWSIVCRHVVSSIEESTDPADARSANYLVTDPQALRDWSFPADFVFPFAINCASIVTWKDGTRTHLCDLINKRERRFYRSQLKNAAIDARDPVRLDAMFDWAGLNGVGLGNASRERFHQLIRSATQADVDRAASQTTGEADEDTAEPVSKRRCA